MEGDDDFAPFEARNYYFNRMMYPSPGKEEIEEIIEVDSIEVDSKSKSFKAPISIDGGASDVYVAVGGEDDLHLLTWALKHAVSPGSRVFLIHIFPPLTYIPTPVGKLAISQLSQEQVRKYMLDENNRRKLLLEKYIGLCNEAKVTVETMLIESNVTTKAIVDLIPVLNITQLVIGTKNPPSSRRPRKKMAKWEVVKRNAPESCEVMIVCDGKKVLECGEALERVQGYAPQSTKKFCGCF